MIIKELAKITKYPKCKPIYWCDLDNGYRPWDSSIGEFIDPVWESLNDWEEHARSINWDPRKLVIEVL
jgi:hypothetical protein